MIGFYCRRGCQEEDGCTAVLRCARRRSSRRSSGWGGGGGGDKGCTPIPLLFRPEDCHREPPGVGIITGPGETERSCEGPERAVRARVVVDHRH